MSSTNDFLNLVNKTTNFFGLTERRIRAFADGAARGAVWLVLWAIAIATPLFISYFITAQTPGSSIDDFSRTVITSLIQAAGGVSSFSSVGGAIESAQFFIDAALRPTALTLAIAFIAYKRGRIRQASEVNDKVSENTGMAYSLGLGAGFATLASVVALFVNGLVNSAESVRFESASILTWVSMVVILALPSWLGGLREASSKRSTSPWVWFYSTLRTFGITYSVLILAALLVIGLYFLITPVFAYSLPDVEPVAPAKLTPEQVTATLLSIAAVILYLPTILYYVLTFGMGGNIGLLSDIQGVNLFESLNGLLPTEFVFGLGNFNLQTTIGWIPLTASILLVSLVALVSGTAAAYKTQAVINFKKHFVITVSASAASAAVLTYLTTLSISWTNRGKEVADIANGELTLESGVVSYGVTAASLILIVGLVSVFSTLGASSSNQFTSGAFPKVLSWLSRGRSSSNESRSLASLVFGTAVTVAILATAAAPVALATVERTWATIDSPANKMTEVTDILQKGKIEDAKKAFSTDASKDLPWLADDILKKARPTDSMSKTFTLKNANDSGWQVGQLDAIGKFSWKVSETESIKLNLAAEGKVKEHLKIITHADYKVLPSNTTLQISLGEFMAPTGKANLKVNGKPVIVGLYNALPGAYEITTDAFKLVAATKKTFATAEVANSFVPAEEPSLKPEYEKILATEINRLAKECTKFTEINKAECFTIEEIYNNRSEKGKETPSKFFGFQTTGFKVTGSTCDFEAEDKLLSAAHIYRESLCLVEMSFTLDYFKSKAETRKVSRQETYNSCPEFSEAVCARTRTINLGTKEVEVRGDKIGSATFTSSVPILVDTIGFLDDKDKFRIVDKFVKPTYKPLKVVVVKPVAKKFELLGYYPTLADLKTVQTSPKLGDAYAVTAAHDMYVWSGKQWSLVD